MREAKIDPRLRTLVDRCSRLWAAEAEVVRTYWDWSGRSVATDRLWILRQVYKELIDGVGAGLAQIRDPLRRLDNGCDREAIGREIDTVHDEYRHYLGFVSLYETLDDGTARCPGPEMLRREASWPENDALMALRKYHCMQHGEIGDRARRFTEGGYCTLFSEGMKLAGREGLDGRIARLCASVCEDELGHVLDAVADVARPGEALTDVQWALLTRLAVAQLELRVHMRNAQFSYPVGPERIRTMLAGACEPLPFDYDRVHDASRGRATRDPAPETANRETAHSSP